MHCRSMAGDANTESYESLGVRPQNLNVKILRSYAVTLSDLSMEANVNRGNTAANQCN